jgi:hypothetical protein
LLIFTFHKVYSMKRCDSDLTIADALIRLIRRDGYVHDSFVLTSMNVVSRNYSSANNHDEQYDDFDDNGIDDDDDDDDDTRPAEAPPPLQSLDWADLKSKLIISDNMKVTNANYGTTTSMALSHGASANIGSSSSRPSRMSFESSLLDLSSKSRRSCASEEEQEEYHNYYEDKSFSSLLLHDQLTPDNSQRSSITVSVKEESHEMNLQPLHEEYDEDNRIEEKN